MQNVLCKVDLSKIVYNTKVFRRRAEKLCAVVKADAYGHGAVEVASAIEKYVDMFAVATETEGVGISSVVGDKEILVLTPPVDFKETVALVLDGFIVSVSDTECAKRVVQAEKKTGRTARVHVKINTGMNRYGVDEHQTERLVKYLYRHNVKVEGVYSHLFKHEIKSAKKQRDVFLRAVNTVKKYYPSATAHLSATYGSLLGKDFAFDMIRVGLGLYGYLPSDAEESLKKDFPTLKKAMRMYAYTVQSRPYSFGGVGYTDAKNRLKKKGVSVLRVGYADGFSRIAPPLGNVPLCMDAMPVYGRKRKGKYSLLFSNADRLAKKQKTISYEILSKAPLRAEYRYKR